MTSRLLASVLLASLSLAAVPARAAVTQELDLDTLSQQADLIVQGTAEGTEASWSADGKRIHSVTRVRVGKSLKGQAAQVVEVRHPGGTVGDITQRVAGAPAFAPGEEVILFLKQAPGQLKKAAFVVEGLGQGKFEVVRGKDGAKQVLRRTQGLGVVGPDGAVRPAPQVGPVDEEAFVGRVQRAIKDNDK